MLYREGEVLDQSQHGDVLELEIRIAQSVAGRLFNGGVSSWLATTSRRHEGAPCRPLPYVVLWSHTAGVLGSNYLLAG